MTAIAAVGPLTSLVETVSTTVAAGILLGGFAIGAVGLLAGRSREEVSTRALTDGYAGGALGAGALLVDLILRYGL
jgi:hypothetical protein